MNSTNSTNGLVEGWVWGSDQRGTVDLLWTSILTIVLCSWNTLYLNIAPAHWTRRRRFGQKVLFFLLSILGPEFILQIAFGQWASAKRSVQAFSKLHHPDNKSKPHHPWTMRHAFLADMGCFRLDLPDLASYPLSAKQLHYLVERGHVDYYAISMPKSEIDDRDKSDGVLLLITVVQILWFSFNLNGRAWFGNSLTPLELTAIAYILPTLAVFWLWRHKPLDTTFTITLQLKTTLAQIRAAHARGPDALLAMPLDDPGRALFPRRKTTSTGLLATATDAPAIRRSKIPDDNFPFMPRWATLVCVALEISYAGIHVWGWNFFFPTPLEQMLWRISGMTLFLCIAGFWIGHFIEYRRWRKGMGRVGTGSGRERRGTGERRGGVDMAAMEGGEWDVNMDEKPVGGARSGSDTSFGKDLQPASVKRAQTTFASFADKMRSNSGDIERGMGATMQRRKRWTGLIPVIILGVFYVVARGFIVVECFASLRVLPKDAYRSVMLNDILPNFG